MVAMREYVPYKTRVLRENGQFASCRRQNPTKPHKWLRVGPGQWQCYHCGKLVRFP